MDEKEIIKIHNVTKRFGGLVALDKVTFNIYKGEILGIIGPNGAGKTTLFNCITGVYRPDDGKIFFNGLDITGKPPHRITQLGIVKTHQIVKPFNEFTVLENAMIGALFGRRAGKISKDEAREIALKNLELVGLIEKKDELASGLTLHEKKFLELARALSAEPEVILLDEALAGLNPKEVEESLDIVRMINKELGKTIVMVEHVMHAVMNVANRIVVLHFGKLLAEGSPKEVAEMPEVITAYLGDKDLALKFVKR